MWKIKYKLKTRHIAFASLYLGIASVLLSFQNCAPVKFVPLADPANLSAANPICQPFQNGSGTGSIQNGILSSITYILPTSTVITQNGGSLSTNSFMPGQQDVQVIPNPVYLNQFSVFTQNFTLGFQAASGSTINDLNGNELVQYFSIHSQGFIGLAPNAALGTTTAGTYQFAVLSDDGSVFSLGDGNGNFQPLINNDGNHSNRFSCAQSVVDVTAGNMIPFKLDYYQGPPVRIALMLFWRLVDTTNPSSMTDSLCPSPQYGTTEGDTYFFGVDPVTGLPVATTEYYNATAGSTTGILNRGWQVIPAGNFYLANGTTNPCN